MSRVEEIIRMYLASHLTFLSEDIHIIQEEYPLPNELGTRGSIDILARDDENRYVIIEVKRTNQAARQALHEINKYAALIKQRFHVRESEIRIIIVSSEWEELLVPYSEWFHHTDYWVEGYQISLDGHSIPIDKKLIVPVEETLRRNISPVQLCFLSSREETMGDMVNAIKNAMTHIGIADFIIVVLSREQTIPYPFCAYLAFQRYSKQFYLNLLKSSPKGQKYLEEDVTEDEGEEQFLLDLEDVTLALVVEQVLPESMENGNPDKFDYLVRNWQIKDIIRSGFFKRDTRLTNEMLIAEISGLHGSSKVMYVDSGHSVHKSKVKEIEENVVHSLAFNLVWKKHILSTFSQIKKQDRKCKIDIVVYCPSQILNTLIYLYRRQYEYLPTYLLVIDFSDETHIYEGKIKWNGSIPVLRDILKAFFPKNSFEYFIHMHLGTIRKFDNKIMKKLGLSYSSNRIIIRDDITEHCEDFKIIEKGVRCSPSREILTVEDFVDSSGLFLSELYDFYALNMSGF